MKKIITPTKAAKKRRDGRIIDLWWKYRNEGTTTEVMDYIAYRVKVSRPTVRRVLDAAGIEYPTRKKTSDEDA